MDDTRRSFKQNFATPSARLMYALLRNIQDPDTGERLADDPNFKALLGQSKSHTRAA